MKIKFTRDVPGKRPRKRGEVADYQDDTARQLIACGVAEPAEAGAPKDNTSKKKSTKKS